MNIDPMTNLPEVVTPKQLFVTVFRDSDGMRMWERERPSFSQTLTYTDERVLQTMGFKNPEVLEYIDTSLQEVGRGGHGFLRCQCDDCEGSNTPSIHPLQPTPWNRTTVVQ